MIVISVELWPLGDVTRRRLIGQAAIINDGSHLGNPNRGNYDVFVVKKSSLTVPGWWREPHRFYRRGRVENYPRLRWTVWFLIQKALNGALGEPPK